MEENLKSGTSTKSLNLSKLDTTTNHGISKTQERQQKCKSIALTHNGSNFSNSEIKTLSIQLTIEFLMFNTPKMLKVKLS
jgi:hypothetical protein